MLWEDVDMFIVDEWFKFLMFIGLGLIGWDMKVCVGKKKVYNFVSFELLI